ncbi:beta-1,2-xylosyltransferase XYXT1 [Cocos nucifera]|uniref:Beta-1,2-xylosyltransferase XYXT1 n=1 Tax=Cocos nucifera TaxID=13894 RepID=A0A8K0I1A7_COCNU|nr:beta-1,2-xylosyltransferase XYXT1 [Cocos nucifera]
MYFFDNSPKKPKRVLLRLIFLFILASCSLLFFPRLLFCTSSHLCPLFYSFEAEEKLQVLQFGTRVPCSSPIPNNTMCCDRSAFRSDVCFMRGDVRTQSYSKIILLYPGNNASIPAPATEERIRPYTRKWETSVMATIDELRLTAGTGGGGGGCDVRHAVPAVVFSAGGYTGNVYHEFNDGIIPLFITSQKFNRRVVFVVVDYHNWWFTKYGDVLSGLSDYPPLDFFGDSSTHCFPEAIVGLRIHDELTVDAEQMENNKTIFDFRRLLDDAYQPRIRSLEYDEQQTSPWPSMDIAKQHNSPSSYTPKLVIVSRNGSRAIENEVELVKLGEEIGFIVEVLRPDRTTELAKIYRALNSSDAMIGVHGAAMTHLLFMRPGSVFIQIVPLGTDWAAKTYYGDPAVRMGLWYVGYKILKRESSLYREYDRSDPVLTDPRSVAKKGWHVTKRVYLDRQNVNLDMNRFRKHLIRAHKYLASKKRIKHGKEK